MKTLTKYISATVLAAFGFLTIFLTTTILLDLVGMREKQGNYVEFVIWVNLFCGMAYVVSAYGFLKQKEWTYKVLALALVILIITFISFYFYVENGGIHKEDTFGALTFRISITALFALIARYTVKHKIK